MTRWRAVVIAALLIVPVLFYMGVGLWAIWQAGWFLWLWAVLPAGWGAAWLLARRWQANLLLVAVPETAPPMQWTPRDAKAWELIEAREKAVADVLPDKLTEVQFYIDTANEITVEIARFYHPKARDPFGALTIPEILAAAELAVEDLAELVERYVPAGHLVTVDRWRSLARLPGWYRTLEKFYWPLSALISPATLVGRYAASRWIVTPVLQAVQVNLLAWFYVSFVNRVGLAAIELNSGRLRGGAKRYRESLHRIEDSGVPDPRISTRAAPAKPAAPEEPAPEEAQVTICLVGQVKAGKSSLINALLGERQAETDVLPKTTEVARYRLEIPGRRDRLVLLDTVGYSVDGATPRQVEETRTAVRQSDLVLLVMHAGSPAREPDRQFLQALADWFEAQPKFKPPPLLGVLTHIDLLRPVMEWSPPYDWRTPSRPKEHSIHDAVEYNAGALARFVRGVVPVCSDVERGRVHGVEEWLLPAMTPLLGEARACALIRTLHTDFDRDRVQRIFRQSWDAGKALVKAGAGW